ncbi:MAG: hypothetical protein JW982_03240, partial [Spirochaetes bacterium]|nr:hypothetical protein [Spirochaetota bacterium]
CLVANNVLAKIIEEENVKIDLYNPNFAANEQADNSKLMLYIVLLIGLLITFIGIMYVLI